MTFIAAICGAIIGLIVYMALQFVLPGKPLYEGFARWVGMTIYLFTMGWGLENEDHGWSRTRTGDWVHFAHGDTLRWAPFLGLAVAILSMFVATAKNDEAERSRP